MITILWASIEQSFRARNSFTCSWLHIIRICISVVFFLFVLELFIIYIEWHHVAADVQFRVNTLLYVWFFHLLIAISFVEQSVRRCHKSHFASMRPPLSTSNTINVVSRLFFSVARLQHIQHQWQEEPSTQISDRCSRSRINSAIFVSSEGKGFDSIEFLRRHGSQSVLCRKARSAENITDEDRKVCVQFIGTMDRWWTCVVN